MAGIEPISSAMVYQAQPVQKQVVTEPKSETMDVNTQDMPMADATTVAVNKVEEKDSENNKQDGSQNGQQQPSNDQIKKAVEKLNKQMSNSEAVFGIHDKTNRVTIKIVDKDTKEVIKELPPEKTLDMIAKAWELAGLLVDEKR